MEKIKQWLPFSVSNDESRSLTSQDSLRIQVAIKDLPLYPSKADLSQYRYVEDPPLPLQENLTGARIKLQENYRNFMNKYGAAQNFVNNTKDVAKTTSIYLRDEAAVLPKAIAITVGGMAGFLFGMKRGGVFKRAAYSGLGMTTMAAFCYPNESVDIVRGGLCLAKRQWRQFQQSPAPPDSNANEAGNPVKYDTLPPMPNANDNIDMYTTRSNKIS